MRPHKLLLIPFLATLLIAAAPGSRATPISPTRDDEVVDVLPAVTGSRAEARRLRQQLAQQPQNTALALTAARRYLDQAHELGDPRFAGMAMAAIQPWQDPATMPTEVLMMRANLQQYLHEFDASVASLQQLLARPSPQPRPQAWLTLATVRRVQGRYAESDKACEQVAANGAALHANACLAENAGLRGDADKARAVFESLLTSPGLPAGVRSWLTTSLAELEERAGRATQADAAFRTALKLDPDPYAMVAYADFLIEQGRSAQALTLLKDQVRTDAIVLRLAIAGTLAKAPTAAADVAEMRERINLANERPDAKLFHGREQAMFALKVDKDAARALELARGNAEHQREPLDLLVLAQAARASGKPAALKDAQKLTQEMGLVDQRIKALL